MWNLIRDTFRRWRGQQQRSVNSVAQTNGCLNVAAQVCYDDKVVFGTSIRPHTSTRGRQREVNNSIQVTERGGRFVKNEWSVRNVVNRDYYSNISGARVGVVCHDGSYRFWEWDSKKGCFVPLVLK
jgi:hypothetical protein